MVERAACILVPVLRGAPGSILLVLLLVGGAGGAPPFFWVVGAEEHDAPPLGRDRAGERFTRYVPRRGRKGTCAPSASTRHRLLLSRVRMLSCSKAYAQLNRQDTKPGTTKTPDMQMRRCPREVHTMRSTSPTQVAGTSFPLATCTRRRGRGSVMRVKTRGSGTQCRDAPQSTIHTCACTQSSDDMDKE